MVVLLVFGVDGVIIVVVGGGGGGVDVGDGVDDGSGVVHCFCSRAIKKIYVLHSFDETVSFVS